MSRAVAPGVPVRWADSHFALDNNPAHMDSILELLKREDAQDALWFVDVCERNGNMNQPEGDEWRRRILARQRFLKLEDSQPLS